MERPIRRKDRILDESKIPELLAKCKYGILSTISEDNEPYGVPLSYVYDTTKKCIYFHCATVGHKLDNIANNNKVTFTVVGETQPVFDKNFTTYYESVIVFGNAHEVTDENEKYDFLMELCNKYLPDYIDVADKYIKGSFAATKAIRIDIYRVTGKEKAPKKESI